MLKDVNTLASEMVKGVHLLLALMLTQNNKKAENFHYALSDASLCFESSGILEWSPKSCLHY